MRGDIHVRFGGRDGETSLLRGRSRAPARPHPCLVVFLAVHPSTYRTAGLRWGTATSSSTRSGTTSPFAGHRDEPALAQHRDHGQVGSGAAQQPAQVRAPITLLRASTSTAWWGVAACSAASSGVAVCTRWGRRVSAGKTELGAGSAVSNSSSTGVSCLPQSAASDAAVAVQEALAPAGGSGA